MSNFFENLNIKEVHHFLVKNWFVLHLYIFFLLFHNILYIVIPIL